MPRSSSPGGAGHAHGTHALEALAQPPQLALGARDDPQLVALAVEGVERVDRGELDRGQREVVARELRDRLERADEVVAERAEQAAAEGRRAGRHVGGEAVEQRARLVQRPGGIAPREHGGGPRREIRPAALSRFQQHAARASQRAQCRSRLDAARRDGVREHAGTRSQVPGSSSHGSASAWARAAAATPSRSAASRSRGIGRSAAVVELHHLAESARRGREQHALGVDELGQRDRPRFHRHAEPASEPPAARRGRRPGSSPSTDGVTSALATRNATLAFVASPTRPSCATSSASS